MQSDLLYARDTVDSKLIIVAAKETIDDRKTITDILVINSKYFHQDSFIQIGSYETKNGQKTDAFVIAIEQERPDNKPGPDGVYPARPSKSTKIFNAWTFDCANDRLRKISLKGLHRINEGYYRD